MHGFLPAISTAVVPHGLGREHSFQRARKRSLGLFYQSMLIPMNEVANAEETGESQDEDNSGNSVMQLEKELPEEVTTETKRRGPQDRTSCVRNKEGAPSHPVHASEEGRKDAQEGYE